MPKPIKASGKDRPPPIYFGLDGEGHGRAPHLYTLLAVASSDEEHSYHVENEQGLSSTAGRSRSTTAAGASSGCTRRSPN